MRFARLPAADLLRYAALPTEQSNPATRGLDRMTVQELVRAINREDRKVAEAVRRELPKVGRAAELIARSLRLGGRLWFFGAGTSGRLGVIEAAECPPTFGTEPGRVRAVMAGGKPAVFKAKEGAEDDPVLGRAAAGKVRDGDAAVGIAASGVTPFVLAALKEAKRRGAAAVLVTSNARPGPGVADVVISPSVGPEALAGSTRMKSGTAAKLVLNMLTTAAMVRNGRAYRNWMVDLRPTSRKLVLRAVRLVSRLGGVGPEEAQRLLAAAGGHPKTAIVMARRGLGAAQARRLLEKSGGLLRSVIG